MCWSLSVWDRGQRARSVRSPTHPLEEGVEDGARRGGLPGDVGEGAGGGQQRDKARRAALRSQTNAVEERPAVQLPTRNATHAAQERSTRMGERRRDKRDRRRRGKG